MLNPEAQWIWTSPPHSDGYNEAIIARRGFDLAGVGRGTIRISADSWYRLFVNGTWVHDGPCRSWPWQYQYDVHDVSPLLRPGRNEIVVLARYFGAGHFHRIPVRGGLIASLNVAHGEGADTRIVTDASWEVAEYAPLLRNTPKVGLGMEPAEEIDARRAPSGFAPPAVVMDQQRAPWKNLGPRDVALMTKEPRALSAVLEANVVERSWQGYAFSLVRLLYPGLIEGEGHTCMASIAATVVVCDEPMHINVRPYPPTEGPMITVNGEVGDDGGYAFKPGRNLVLAFFEPWGHHNKEQGLRFDTTTPLKLENPSSAALANPWDFVRFAELLYHEHDDRSSTLLRPERSTIRSNVEKVYQKIGQDVHDVTSYREILADRAVVEDRGRWPLANPHWQFECRSVLGSANHLLDDVTGILADNSECLTVAPDPVGDVEVVLDLGDQVVGYYDLEFFAEEGTVVDLFGIEFISRDRGVQHTWSNRNGMRYTARAGWNSALSMKRRSGRYLFLTLRNQRAPVKLRKVRVIESTYPVNRVGSFSCSDAVLNRVWAISERTLQLCMEDAFTDCPLYEQTLWVGDARNEGLFSLTAYGQTDIVARCVRLAAQGLDKFPIVPSHVPTSSNECLLPAWSFLWGISVHDYWFYTGDTDFLRSMWPAVLRNLRGAKSFSSKEGLFSAYMWNMFDWSGIDDGHLTVTHNSMLLMGCLDAAIRCGEILGDDEALAWLRGWRVELAAAIDGVWNPSLGSYVDSIHEDGSPSTETCIHTNMLAVLFDIAGGDKRTQAIANVLAPPDSMTGLGSPFVTLYLYEMLEKVGHADRIIDHIVESYVPMLREGATTVWEQFDGGTAFNPDGFPTRSHAHAWSSSPIHFLNRLVLGVRPVEPACRRYTISPRVNRHAWAEGATATLHGPVAVSWKKTANGLVITAEAPPGVVVEYQPNATHEGIPVTFNGRRVALDSDSRDARREATSGNAPR